MSEQTPYLGLNKPTEGDTDWATELNANWDKIDDIHGGKARAYLSANQTVAHAGDPKIVEFDGENYDIRGEFDITTNHRFTAKKTGYYFVTASVMWRKTGDGIPADAILQAYIFKNGSGAYGSVSIRLKDTAIRQFTQVISDIVPLSKDDYIDIRAWQNSFGDVEIEADENQTWVSIHQMS